MKFPKIILSMTLLNVFINAYVEKPIVVLIPSFNNHVWYKKNLDSVFNQDYKNYRVLYIDDCSTDKTGDLVENYITENKLENKITLIKNKYRVTAMENIYKGIHLHCQDNEIIVKLDGDDWFAHNKVLARINQEYQNPDIWLTYGNYIDDPLPESHIGVIFCKKIPENCLATKLRDGEVCGYYTPGHPLTFYSWLFKKIPLKDILFEGKMPTVGYDGFMNFPMMEMARFHHAYIPDILYIHNCDNPLNDFKTNGNLQTKIGLINMSRPAYDQLDIKPILHDKFNDIIPIVFLSNHQSLLKETTIILKQLKRFDTAYVISINTKHNIEKNVQIKKNTSLKYIETTEKFSDTLLKILLNKQEDYVLFLPESTTRKLDTKEIIKILKMTKAPLLFFDINKNIKTKNFPYVHIKNTIYAVQLWFATSFIENFSNHEFVMCNKDYLVTLLKNFNIENKQQLFKLFMKDLNEVVLFS